VTPEDGSSIRFAISDGASPAGEKVQAARGTVRKNFVLSCMPDVVPVLLHFRPRLLSDYASLAVRFARAHRCAFLLGTDLAIRRHGKVVSGGIPSAGYSVVM